MICDEKALLAVIRSLRDENAMLKARALRFEKEAVRLRRAVGHLMRERERREGTEETDMEI